MNKLKYIPGDLVMTNGTPIGTKKGVAYVVTASDPDRAVTLKDGTVLKGSVTLDDVTEGDKAYFVETSTWVKHIVPIYLTPEILENNGFEKNLSDDVIWYKWFTGKSYLYIRKHIFIKNDWLVCVGLEKRYIADIRYVHQLQHLFFGLGLDSSMIV